MKEIIINLPVGNVMHRFDGPVYAEDYFVDEADPAYVVYFPDPSDGAGWPNRKVPRRGISFFMPLQPTGPHGKPVMVSSDAICFVLSERSLPEGWRMVYDRDLKFRTNDGSHVIVRHFLMYTAVAKTVSAFLTFKDAFNWLPCTLAAAAHPYVLSGDFESEQGQASSLAVIALRLIKYMWNAEVLDAWEQLLMADIHNAIAEAKKPLRYLKLSRVEDLLYILRRHDVGTYHEDQKEDLLEHLEKIMQRKNRSPASKEDLSITEGQVVSGFESEDEDYSDDDESSDTEVSQAAQIISTRPPATTPVQSPSTDTATSSSGQVTGSSSGADSQDSLQVGVHQSVLGRRLYGDVFT
eukprot:gene18419-20969_t